MYLFLLMRNINYIQFIIRKVTCSKLKDINDDIQEVSFLQENLNMTVRVNDIHRNLKEVLTRHHYHHCLVKIKILI